jgi:hypothetical protein
MLFVYIVCYGTDDVNVPWIALGVYDDGYGRNSGNLLLSRNWREGGFGYEEGLWRGDAASNVMDN